MVYKAHTWVDDSEPYIVAEHLNEMEAGIAAAGGMLSPCAQDTPDMTLAVVAGRAYLGSTLYEYAGGNTAAFSAPSANPYIALISLQSGGSLNITYGAEAASPTAPATPTDEIPIYQVYIPVGATSIKNANDGSNGYLYKDVRPFIQGGGGATTQYGPLLYDHGDASPKTIGQIPARSFVMRWWIECSENDAGGYDGELGITGATTRLAANGERPSSTADDPIPFTDPFWCLAATDILHTANTAGTAGAGRLWLEIVTLQTS